MKRSLIGLIVVGVISSSFAFAGGDPVLKAQLTRIHARLIQELPAEAMDRFKTIYDTFESAKAFDGPKATLYTDVLVQCCIAPWKEKLAASLIQDVQEYQEALEAKRRAVLAKYRAVADQYPDLAAKYPQASSLRLQAIAKWKAEEAKSSEVSPLWRMTWAVFFPKLSQELPADDALPKLKAAFHNGAAESVNNLFTVLNGMAAFTGINAEMNVKTLIDALDPLAKGEYEYESLAALYDKVGQFFPVALVPTRP
jgi:hypothetical protein